MKRSNTGPLSEEDQRLTDQTAREIQAAGLTLDHIVAVTRGGEHAWYNLNGLTHSTNCSKSDRDLGPMLCWLEMREEGLPLDEYERQVLERLRGSYRTLDEERSEA